MFDESKIKYVIVEFLIPYGLDVSNSLKPGDTGETYIVFINGIPCEIRTDRIYNTDDTYIAPNSKIDKDNYGLLSKTKLQVWFDDNTLNLEDFRLNSVSDMSMKENIYFFRALEYTNRFIKEYKRVTKNFWLKQIFKDDILRYNICLLDEKENKIIFTKLCNNLVTFNGKKEICLDEEQDKQLRNILSCDYSNFKEDLNMSIFYNLNDMHYNISLIQCAIYFENFIYSLLKSKVSGTKLDKMKKKDCGCLVGISEVCKKGLKEAFDVDFGTTDEFINFNDKVLKIRNELVHGERLEEISRDQCMDAMKATENAIKYLNSNIK